jgi:hypothetical protein
MLPLGIRANALAHYRIAERVGDGSPASATRSVRTGLDLPLGPVVLETDADLGTITTDASRAYRQLRSGLRWTGRGQWAWIGLAHYDAGLGAPATAVDLTGAVRLAGVELQGGLNGRLDGARLADAVTLWSGSSVPVSRSVRVDWGVDYRPHAAGSPWRFSLGVSRSLRVPLPVTRAAALHGVVFEDRDGDLRRGPGEPPLRDVAVLFGPLRTTTDGEGRYVFHDAVNGRLSLGPAALPAGYVVPAEAHLSSSGRVDIPVIRTATLELVLFLDRDGDEEKDPAEDAAKGVVVSLVDREGRRRDAASDDEGRITLRSLSPGSYTLLVHAPDDARAPAPPLEIPLSLAPGATEARTVAVPLRRREVRMPGGGRP